MKRTLLNENKNLKNFRTTFKKKKKVNESLSKHSKRKNTQNNINGNFLTLKIKSRFYHKFCFTLFFPLRLMSLQRDNWSSDISCLDNRSLNSSIGKCMMSCNEQFYKIFKVQKEHLVYFILSYTFKQNEILKCFC